MDTTPPIRYEHTLPIFSSQGRVTRRVVVGLRNVLDFYVECAKIHSYETNNNPENYAVEHVFVVGSGARENKRDSDLDLLLIAPRLDEPTAKALRVACAMEFFSDQPKPEAIDVYVRPKDLFPERPSVDITPQVQSLLDRCNVLLSRK